MGKFQKIDKKALTIGQHYSFISAFLNVLVGAGISAPKFVQALNALNQSLQKEDDCLKLAQGSELTKQLKAQDLIRDHNLGWLKRIVTVWAESGLEPEASAAARLLQKIKLYNINVNAQMDEETGLIENLVKDFASSIILEQAIDTLNVRRFVQTMEGANTQVKELLAQGGRESSEKVVGALKAARAESDANYNSMCDLVESFSLVTDEPEPYELIIKEWNATIDRYKDMLKRKSTKDFPDEDTPDIEPEPTPVEPEA